MSRRRTLARPACVAVVTAVLVVVAFASSPLPASAGGPAAESSPGSAGAGALGVDRGVRLAVALGAPASRAAAAVPAAAGRRFWTSDASFYTSPWYAGRHRRMVPFGCTRAPYYPPDPRCADGRGFHHGLDMAMPCGTVLYARFRTRVVDPAAPGALGPSYGAAAFRLRSARFGTDFVIGHVRRVFVRPGQVVRRGQRIARASDAGAPDGCHLHFEVRPAGDGYRSAIGPRGYLGLHRVSE